MVAQQIKGMSIINAGRFSRPAGVLYQIDCGASRLSFLEKQGELHDGIASTKAKAGAGNS
jgi:hypothetical protein